MKISVSSKARVDLIDITAEVEKNVKIKEGIVVVYAPHTTCGIFINENDSGLKKDILKLLEKLVPQGVGWDHDPQEGNADSHMRGILLGNSVVVPVEGGELKLGRYQSIFFAELFGPQERKVIVKEVEG